MNPPNRATAGGEPSFNLLRRFGVASLVIIAAVAVINGALLSNFLTKRLLDRLPG